MQSSFWSNTIWYILLAVPSFISIAFTLYKSSNRNFICGFSMAVLGLTFFAETGILTLFNGYRYLPKISSDSFLDAIIGNYFSQFFLTTGVVLIIVYKMPTIWNFIFAGINYSIENLFIKLGIYQHFWYKTWFTPIVVLLMLWVVRKWYYHMLDYPKKYIYYLTLYTGANALVSFVAVFPIYAFSIQVINVSFGWGFFREQAILIVSYRSILIAIMIILYRMRLKWIWTALGFAFLFMLQYILMRIDFLTIKEGLFSIITFIFLFGAYFSVAIVDYLLGKGSAATQS